MKPNKSKDVVDEYYNTHTIYKKIGEGGQGTVYRSKDTDIAIKIAIDHNTNKKLFNIEQYAKKLAYLISLPLPTDINITKPMASLKNEPGYVMKLLDKMVSIEKFKAKDLENYINTGGIKKRLYILAKISSILSELHSLGMTYGDVSDNNVFISESNYEAWLIDPDNIKLFKKNNKNNVVTPKYGAPEIVQNKSGTSFSSDCYSFAILAYWILSLNHPFIGDYVIDGDDWENDSDESLDDQAYSGNIPWINDLDTINSTTNGLPQNTILTNKLKQLFQNTFGLGRTEIKYRNTIFHWTPAFIEANDLIIECLNSDCKMQHFYYNNKEVEYCQYCKSNIENSYIFNSYLVDSKDTKHKHWTLISNFIHKISLPHRLFNRFCNKNYDRDVISIEKIDSDNIKIKTLENYAQKEIKIMTGNKVSTFTNNFTLNIKSFSKGLSLSHNYESNTIFINVEKIGSSK